MKSDIEDLRKRKSRMAYKRDAASKTHPEKPSQCPQPPKWMSADGKKVWNEMAGEIYQAGLLGILDRGPFALYCEATAEYRRHAAEVVAEGSTIVKEHYAGAHPAAKLRDDAWKRASAQARLCGLSRVARQGIKLDDNGPKIGEIIDKRGGFAT